MVHLPRVKCRFFLSFASIRKHDYASLYFSAISWCSFKKVLLVGCFFFYQGNTAHSDKLKNMMTSQLSSHSTELYLQMFLSK